jgi:DNA-binding CsgD family transcriptional regulator
LTPFERDRAIVELRKRGYTYRQIGKAVGMSPSSVLYAWRRLAAGGPGTRPR